MIYKNKIFKKQYVHDKHHTHPNVHIRSLTLPKQNIVQKPHTFHAPPNPTSNTRFTPREHIIASLRNALKQRWQKKIRPLWSNICARL